MTDQKKYSRREMLRFGAGGLLALGLWPGALRAAGKGQPGNFSFLVVNDIHYFDNRCGEWLEGAVGKMKGHPEHPDFCVLAGDLADSGSPVQLAAVRDLFKTIGIPVYCVPGNHDYVTNTDRKPYEQIFPDSINYQFEHKGWQFVALDTTMGQKAIQTQIQPATLSWVDDTIPGFSKTRPTIILTHFPLGPDIAVRPLNANLLLDRFQDYNLQAAFSGHFHGYTEKHVRGATLTTDKCCSFHAHNHDGTKEKGYFLCLAQDGAVTRTFVQVG